MATARKGGRGEVEAEQEGVREKKKNRKEEKEGRRGPVKLVRLSRLNTCRVKKLFRLTEPLNATSQTPVRRGFLGSQTVLHVSFGVKFQQR